MDPFLKFLLAVFIYETIGVAVAKVLYARKHGISIRIIGGGWDATPALPIMLLWPIYLAVPSLRNPELCRHPHHIMIRDELRQQDAQLAARYQAAVERDERYR